MATEDRAYLYAAFISYRHIEPDRNWAKWLHTSLETYRVPKKLVEQRNIARRVGRVFRDEEELPASADLNQEIESALGASRFLIVICSPRTPLSQWVNKEIVRFREMGRHDHILALLIEGEPGESFPVALREIRRCVTDEKGPDREKIEEVEPLAADVRRTRTESAALLRRMAKLRLLACVLGCRFDDLRQREQERRNRRIMIGGVMGGVVMCVLAVVTAFANIQRIKANANAARADANAHEAELRLADGLVSQGNVFASALQWSAAFDAYQKAERKYAEANASAFKADVALCVARSVSPPALLTLGANRFGDGAAIGSVRYTYHNGITSIAISPDGGTALSSSWSGEVKLWNFHTGNEIRTVKAPEGVGGVAFSSDGRTALLGCNSFWDLQNNGVIRSVSDRCIAIATGHEGRTALVIELDGTLKLWDVQARKEIRTIAVRSTPATRVVTTPGARTVVLIPGGPDAKTIVEVWDLQSREPLYRLRGRFDYPRAVAISPDGRTLCWENAEKTLTLWDLQSGKEIRVLTGFASIGATISISPDARTALSDGGNTVKLWDLETGNEIRTLSGHTKPITSVAFSPDGHQILSGSGDSKLKLWDPQTGNEILTLIGHIGGITSAKFGPDGRTALSGSDDKTAKLWDLQAGMEIRTFSGHHGSVTSIAVSPDGSTALSGGADGTISLWDLPTGKKIRNLPQPGAVLSVAFSPDGRTALSGTTGALNIWDLQAGKEIRTLRAADGVSRIAFSADGRSALSASGPTGVLTLWDVQSGKQSRNFAGVYAGENDFITDIAFSPDGHVAVTANNLPRLWDLDTGKEIRALIPKGGYTTALAFGPDGRKALSASGNATLSLWDLQTGKETRTLSGHTDIINCIAFGPGGLTALSGSADRTLKLWDLESGAELLTLTGHTAEVTSVALSGDGSIAISGSQDGTLKFWYFSRAARYADFESKVPRAQEALDLNPNDAAALAVLGDWYAFRGLNDWAVELLEKARAGGAAVDPLTLARCYWELSDDLPPTTALTRQTCLALAAREFNAALLACKDEPQKFYLGLCLSAVQRVMG